MMLIANFIMCCLNLSGKATERLWTTDNMDILRKRNIDWNKENNSKSLIQILHKWHKSKYNAIITKIDAAAFVGVGGC